MRRGFLLPLLGLGSICLSSCSSSEEARLRAENSRLRMEIEQLKEALGRRVDARRTLPAAQVLSVRDDLVLISIGRLDGVETGDTLDLRRDSTYVGRLTVTKVYHGSAVGELDPQHPGPGAPPQSGDVAEGRE